MIGKTRRITESERRRIVEEYLTTSLSKREIWERHTGQKRERGQLLRWMRKLGYPDDRSENFVPLVIMAKEPSKETKAALEKRIKELERQLLDSQLKEEAYRRMIEITEHDLKISIQKKPDTK
jgi:hypothetical protein